MVGVKLFVGEQFDRVAVAETRMDVLVEERGGRRRTGVERCEKRVYIVQGCRV